MRLFGIAVLGLAFTLAAVAPGRGADGQEELHRKIDALEQQLKELKELQQAGGEKKSHCMKAFGREKFCSCMAENLPAAVGLEQYVHTVVTPRDGLGYEGMTPEQRKAVDQTLATRDKCAEKEQGGLLW
jgi:hypothetical protein